MAKSTNGWDPQARYLQLDERVSNLRTSFNNLESETRHGFVQQTATITALGSELRGAFSSLQSEFRSGQKTQWPVILTVFGLIISAVLGFGGAIGYAVLAPIQESVKANIAGIRSLNDNLTAIVTGLPDAYIPRRETERLSARSAEDRLRVEELLRTMIPRAEVELLRQGSENDRQRLWADLGKLRETTVERNEWMERNRARDTEIADLNRRVDEVRQDLGSQYTTRDLLLSTQTELRELRDKFERLSVLQGGSPSLR